MHRWGFVELPACDYGAAEQTMRHIVDDCRLSIAVVCRWSVTTDYVVCDERRDSGVPIWFELESLTNVFNFKIMVKRINK
jgi:uncharacterized membrane protein YhdT